MLAGIAAGFGAWKLFDTIMGQLLANSSEFRESWAKLQNTINDILGKLAEELGPILAEAVSDMADWIENSDYVKDLIEGIGVALSEYVIPAIRTAVGWLEDGSNYLAEWFEWFMGVEEQRNKLAQPVDMGEIEAMVAARGGFAQPSRSRVGFEVAGGSMFGSDGRALNYLATIADRTEVPR